MAHRSILSWLGTVVFFLLLGAAATARAEPPQGAGPEAGAAGTARDQALQWVDRYRRDQTLFHDKDIERLVDRISRATPAQAEAWREETQANRAAVDSPQWKETQQWFKEFLEVRERLEAFDHRWSPKSDATQRHPDERERRVERDQVAYGHDPSNDEGAAEYQDGCPGHCDE